MTDESSRSSDETGLRPQREGGLANTPNVSPPVLLEMINRSLVHIQTSKTLAAPERRAGEEQEFEIAPGVKIVMCWIPAGDFLMGSLEDEMGRDYEEAQHRVTITQGFWLGKFQVTQTQWEAVIGSNPSHFNGPNLPVEQVSWDDICAPGGFIEKINRFSAAGSIFSLPTEAQWEYACRAGMMTTLNNGKDLTTENGACPNLDEVAWYNENSGDKTHPVGQKYANAWGLHDMHGNVYEWCVDWKRRANLNSGMVYRGGSCLSLGVFCRAAFRHIDLPSMRSDRNGFRLACNSVPKIKSGENERNDSMGQVTNVAHVATSKTLSKLHRIGDHELQSPDYQLVCYWAEQLNLTPEEVLKALLENETILGKKFPTSLIDGKFDKLYLGPRLKKIDNFPEIKGLIVQKLALNFFDPKNTKEKCQLSKLNLSSFRHLRHLQCNHTLLNDLDLSQVADLSFLDCYQNKLTHLDLLKVPNLTYLNCARNQLINLNLSLLPKLNALICNDNRLTDLDLSKVPKLEGLICSSNKLANLDLKPVSKLKVLRHSSNHLSELDLSPVPDLTVLECKWNQLTNLDLSEVPNLRELMCCGNGLTDLDLSSVPSLRVLSCNQNQLTSLELSPISNLTELNCGGNQLTDLDLSWTPNLSSLHCPSNRLSYLNFSKTPNLTILECSINHLANLDLSGAFNLTELDCRGNGITCLELAPVPNLINLSCEDNQLLRLDISSLHSLNMLSCDSVSLIMNPGQSHKRRPWMRLAYMRPDQVTRLIISHDQNFK